MTTPRTTLIAGVAALLILRVEAPGPAAAQGLDHFTCYQAGATTGSVKGQQCFSDPQFGNLFPSCNGSCPSGPAAALTRRIRPVAGSPTTSARSGPARRVSSAGVSALANAGAAKTTDCQGRPAALALALAVMLGGPIAVLESRSDSQGYVTQRDAAKRPFITPIDTACPLPPSFSLTARVRLEHHPAY